MRFTGFLASFKRSWTVTIFPKTGCTVNTKLRSIHHFKGLNKGCVSYTGASYTHKITVTWFQWYIVIRGYVWYLCLKKLQNFEEIWIAISCLRPSSLVLRHCRIKMKLWLIRVDADSHAFENGRRNVLISYFLLLLAVGHQFNKVAAQEKNLSFNMFDWALAIFLQQWSE